MADGEHPWKIVNGCVIVRVRVTPKSSKDAIDGVEPAAGGPAIKIKVRAVPAGGEANEAVERLLGDWLGIAKNSVSVTSGHRSRLKSIKIAGDSAKLEVQLATRLLECLRSARIDPAKI